MIVYVATNTVTGHQYVGQTVRTLERRRAQHEYSASAKETRANRHYPLQRAIRKYGREAILWEVLFEHDDPEQINAAEKHYILELNCLVPNGYNQILQYDRAAMYRTTTAPLAVANCQVCKEDFELPMMRYNANIKKGIGFTCGKECEATRKSEMTKERWSKDMTPVSCAYCGKEYEVPKTQYDRSMKWHEGKFLCSNSCRSRDSVRRKNNG